MSVDLSCKIGSLELKNPVMTASGTCGYGEELTDSLDVSSLGALIPKSITVAPRLGNRTPRLAETPSGLVNSIGLQNEGLDEFVEHKLSDIAGLGCPVIANIAGFSVEDFVKMASVLDECAEISGFEVNISCPNVKEGGVQFGVDSSAAAEVTRSVRSATGKTVIVAHAGGFQSLYAHLEEILVWEEMVVDIGAPVGLIGSTGRSTGPHLHFQINKEGKSVDPTNLLGTRVVPQEKAPAGTSGDTESSLGMMGSLP